MENVLIGAILSFAITFYAIPIIIRIADMAKLYDHPGERKIHAAPIPSLGGLGIFGGFLTAFLLLANISTAVDSFQYFIGAFIIVFFFGMKDDVLVITPMKKLLGQVLAAVILMFKCNLLLHNMHGFLNITTINLPISYCLTLFTIIVVMNAYNLIDGVDGLAASIGIITSSFFSFFFYSNGDYFFSMMGFCLAASLIGFLLYNFSPAKIFMGDTGSMFTGIINAILVIRFISTAEDSHIFPILASPAMGFGVLALPLLDTLRVFAIRIAHGRSPFSPDRNHLHHLLLDKGYSHRAITLLLSAATLFFIGFSYLTLSMGTTKVIAAQVVLFFAGILVIRMSKARPVQMKAIKTISSADEISADIKSHIVRLVSNPAEAMAENE
ncbi:MAG: undecaprenyl/decaprenyl-phosphate alpha-N-acetylglucosaminyl 1-phosphate transferase [Bacteroidota bacterium]|nr:undecaprenyl/decaprenyl-phosphate alpha-N-acetylglucosaminyl 1-phosphate transferase [Bacteroidota bacterium]